VPHITETPLSPTPVRPTSAVQPGSVGLDTQLDVPVQLSSKTRPLIRASLHAIASRQRRRRHQQCPEESRRRKSGGPRGWGTDAPSHARWVPRSTRSRAAPDSPPRPGVPCPATCDRREVRSDLPVSTTWAKDVLYNLHQVHDRW